MVATDFFDSLLDYWHQLAARAGGVPPRRDLNPMAIPRLLPHIYLIERKSRYELMLRLAGTALDAVTSDPATGTNLLDRSPDSLRDFQADAFETMAGTPCGLKVERLIHRPPDAAQAVESLTLPLTDGDGEARFAVGIARMSRVYGTPSAAALADIRTDYIDLGFGVPGQGGG